MWRPTSRCLGRKPYAVPAPGGPITLDLRGNEGALPGPVDWVPTAQALRRYPDASRLQALLAARYAPGEEQLLLTAGGDDGLDRLARVSLEPGRDLVLPTPAFEMTRRWAELAGAAVTEVAWPGASFPVVATVAAITEKTGLVALTSPNNPTGAVLDAEALRRISRAAAVVGALVLLDLAYVEYAEEDPTALALTLGNVVVIRTLSKAWGLAGLRVGLVLGPAPVLQAMRSVGAPYAVSGPSLALAEAVLTAADAPVQAHLDWVRAARQQVATALALAGGEVVPSQANFVFARHPALGVLVAGLNRRGIAVRVFPGRPGLEDAVRIGLPADAAGLEQLLTALREEAR